MDNGIVCGFDPNVNLAGAFSSIDTLADPERGPTELVAGDGLFGPIGADRNVNVDRYCLNELTPGSDHRGLQFLRNG